MALPKPLSAYQLFKFGHDTLSIASILGITEAEALEQVSSQRSALLGLPDPHAVSPVSIRIVRSLSQHIQSVQSSGGG